MLDVKQIHSPLMRVPWTESSDNEVLVEAPLFQDLSGQLST